MTVGKYKLGKCYNPSDPLSSDLEINAIENNLLPSIKNELDERPYYKLFYEKKTSPMKEYKNMDVINPKTVWMKKCCVIMERECKALTDLQLMTETYVKALKLKK